MYPSVEKSDDQKVTPDSSATGLHGNAPAIGIPVSSANQTYKSTAPVPVKPPSLDQAPVPWSSSLLDCGDKKLCCFTCFCPCVTFGKISEIIDRGSSSCGPNGTIYALLMHFTRFHWLYSASYRSKLRFQYNLEGSCCKDLLLHLFCDQSAILQEYRELQNRGLDPSIGWHANVERQNPGVMLAPMEQQGMNR